MLQPHSRGAFRCSDEPARAVKGSDIELCCLAALRNLLVGARDSSGSSAVADAMRGSSATAARRSAMALRRCADDRTCVNCRAVEACDLRV